ncbi:unnamed protein product [Dovyalis caffra]|uniref:Uncharacterized protein n=1 Tax=Dovyalis caffra TaxID=77055 RepID=A0AAV1SEC2_9ROSI|nr:unnamed protein product [Dovyalis caffra]
MAGIVAFFLVDKISSFLNEEIKLGEMRITAFLPVAERDSQASVLVKQVREIAFNIEDVLRLVADDRLASNQRNGCNGLVSKITHLIKSNVKHRYQIASEMQSIKTRIFSISRGCQRYKLDGIAGFYKQHLE